MSCSFLAKQAANIRIATKCLFGNYLALRIDRQPMPGDNGRQSHVKSRGSPMAQYPILRPRRLRRSALLRQMVRETRLSPADFIYPLFVRYGTGQKRPISSMPGQVQFTVDQLAAEAREIACAGHPGGDPLRHPGAQRRPRQRELQPGGHRPPRHPDDQRGRAGADRHFRHVLLRIHRSRSLRHHQPA